MSYSSPAARARCWVVVLITILLAAPGAAQTPRKFPPDSLVNTLVIPRSTPVTQVIGTMRNFTSYLGVRCPFCHEGEEGQPLTSFNFASDTKRTKLVARQMMRMVEEINHRLDSLPGIIDRLEAEINKLAELLESADLFIKEPVKFRKASEGMATRQAQLTAAEEEWLILSERA